MKIKFVFFSILLISPIAIYSQGFCFTPSISSNMEFNNTSLTRTTDDNYNYILKIYFHVIRRSNGTGGQSTKSVSDAYNILNNDFNPHRIFFSWDGSINYIDDSSRYNTPDVSIYSINNHQDGIDIYLYDNASNAGGRANGVGESSEFWISGSYWKFPFQSLITSHVISHEMGHVLFLWHTHHGTFNEGGNDNPCAELVNGSNSATCGDYIEDTPADPHLQFDVNQNTCQWHGSGKDRNGHSYNPDTRLIMSYTDVGCMEYFSLMQGKRMRNAIETLPHLQYVLVNKFIAPSISGPSTLCDQATYAINNLPDGATVQWSVSNNNIQYFPHSEAGKAIFEQTGYGSSEIRAAVSFNGTVIASLAFPVNTCQASVTGPSQMCPNSTATFTVNNPIENFTWTSSGPLTLQYTYGNNAVFFSGTSGNGLVAVNIGTSTVVSKYVTISSGGSGSISGPASIASNGSGVYLAQVPCPTSTSYTWKLVNKNNSSDVMTLTTDNPSVTIVSRSGGISGTHAWYKLTASAGSAEYDMNISGGISQKFLLNWNGPILPPDFILYPNPATSSVTISLQEDEEAKETQNYSILSRSTPIAYTIQLWNSFGLLKSVSTDQLEYQLDLYGIPAGFYYVHVIKDGHTYRRQLIIE